MWTKQTTTETPNARCAHSSDSIGDNLYIFGGWSETGVLLNDLHVLNTTNMTWKQEQGDKVPMIGRFGHSTVSVDGKLLLFGGGSMNDEGGIFLNDVLFFQPAEGKWTVAVTKGQIPTGRAKHTSSLIDGRHMIVFGGGDGTRLWDDVYTLDIEKMTWKKEECKGTRPSPRWGHSTVLNGKELIVFGGHEGTRRLNDVHILDTDTMTWRKPEVKARSSTADFPSPRAGHTSSLIGPHMLVWGGGDGRIQADMYGLDTRTWEWWWGGSAPARCAQTTTRIGDVLYAFGGGDGVACFNDVLVLDVRDKLDSIYLAKSQNTKPNSPNTSLSSSPTNRTTAATSRSTNSLRNSPRSAHVSALSHAAISSSPPSSSFTPYNTTTTT
eukprot:TRINITY_DN2862_c1_g1_i2.p1 TRINITY_DN2862_c1_g1~~TRINITY_DN2862_c1_g1_i2.p1  ORF type:complete len:381 (-),score=125.34 TRINITY_DN2862_c1_g1_i2:607-1749(-)